MEIVTHYILFLYICARIKFKKLFIYDLFKYLMYLTYEATMCLSSPVNPKGEQPYIPLVLCFFT